MMKKRASTNANIQSNDTSEKMNWIVPLLLRTREILSKIRELFMTLSNIYDGVFYLQALIIVAKVSMIDAWKDPEYNHGWLFLLGPVKLAQCCRCNALTQNGIIERWWMVE